MNISRKVWLIVGAVILVAALVSVYIIYSRQAGERNDLNTRLSTAQSLSNVLTTQKQALENQLAQAQSLFDTSKSQFPQSVESIEYGEDLYALADECGVELTRLTISPPTGKTVGATTYSVSSFTVEVSGSIGNTLKFIDAIGTGIDYQPSLSFQLPWSVEVKSVGIDVGGSTSISLNIYSYKG